MEKVSNNQSSKNIKSSTVIDHYNNENEISDTILNLNCPKITSLNNSQKHLNGKKTLLSLLKGDNLSSGKFTLYSKSTNNTNLNLGDEQVGNDSEINLDNEVNEINMVNEPDKNDQNECDSSNVSD